VAKAARVEFLNLPANPTPTPQATGKRGETAGTGENTKRQVRLCFRAFPHVLLGVPSWCWGWSPSVASGGVPAVTCFPWALGSLT
jgi:hypothetical protein